MSKGILLAGLLIASAVVCRADSGQYAEMAEVFDGAQQKQTASPVVAASGETTTVILPKSKFHGRDRAWTPGWEKFNLEMKARDEERKKTQIGLIAGGAAFAIGTGIAIAAFGLGAVMLLIVTAGIGAAVGFGAIGIYMLLKSKE